MENLKEKKILKEIKINGIKVKIELPEHRARNFPKKIESTVRIRDKRLEPIAVKSIFF